MKKRTRKYLVLSCTIVIFLIIYILYYKGYVYYFLSLKTISKISSVQLTSSTSILEKPRLNKFSILIARTRYDFIRISGTPIPDDDSHDLLLEYIEFRDELLKTNNIQNFILAGSISLAIDDIIRQLLRSDGCNSIIDEEILSANESINEYMIFRKFENIIQLDKSKYISIDNLENNNIITNKKYFIQFQLKYAKYDVDKAEILIREDYDGLQFHNNCFKDKSPCEKNDPCCRKDNAEIRYERIPHAFEVIKSKNPGDTLLLWCYVLDHRKKVKILKDIQETNGVCSYVSNNDNLKLIKQYLIKNKNESILFYVENSNDLEEKVYIISQPDRDRTSDIIFILPDTSFFQQNLYTTKLTIFGEFL